MFLSPYCLRQYGLWRALLPAAIRALYRPIACGNTGSGSGYVLVSLRAYAYAFLPGVALRYTPGCILAPLQGARDPNRALRATLNTPVRPQVDDDCPIMPLRLFIALRRMVENRLWLALGDIIRRYGQFYTIGPFRLLSTAAYFVDDQIIGNDNHDFACPF